MRPLIAVETKSGKETLTLKGLWSAVCLSMSLTALAQSPSDSATEKSYSKAREVLEAGIKSMGGLDAQMPEMDGFEVIEAIGVEQMPRVIFVTAYDQYTLRAFEVHALDYLLKPFDRERFLKALSHARSSLERRPAGDLNSRLIRLLGDRLAARRPPERLVIKTGGRIYFLSVENVGWIEAADNYVGLRTGRESHLLRETISNLAARLDPGQFLRIRHSTLVNLRHVKELRPLFRGEYLIILRDGADFEPPLPKEPGRSA